MVSLHAGRRSRFDLDALEKAKPKAREAQLPGLFLLIAAYVAAKPMRNLLPLFLDLAGRPVLLVGGGPVAAGKLQQLRQAGATVRVVSPVVVAEIAAIPD